METETTKERPSPLFWNEGELVYYRGVNNKRLVISLQESETDAYQLAATLKSVCAHLLCRKDLGPDELV